MPNMQGLHHHLISCDSQNAQLFPVLEISHIKLEQNNQKVSPGERKARVGYLPRTIWSVENYGQP
jgi:hypothetical protein